MAAESSAAGDYTQPTKWAPKTLQVIRTGNKMATDDSSADQTNIDGRRKRWRDDRFRVRQ